MTIVFPNVPDVLGVPALPRDPLAVASSVVLMTADTLISYGAGLTPAWGLYLNGLPMIMCDTVTMMEYKRDWAIADYPVEEGSFASYDKVNIPFTSRVQFAAGGSAINRQALLDSIAAIAGDLKLYDVVTPEVIYPSVNVQRYNYQRTATNGVGLLLVDVYLVEVRVTATTTSTGTASNSSASSLNASNNGNVQAGADVAPTTSSVQSFSGSSLTTTGTYSSMFQPAVPSTVTGNLLPVQ